MSGPMTPAMPRHPRFTDSFSSLELASFFAQLRAAIDVSLYRPSFCFFRVWLRFLLFLFRVRVSVPVSRAACRVRPNFLPSSSPPSVHPNISVNPPIRRGEVIAHNRCDRFARSDWRNDIAAAEAPAGLSLLFPHPSFQRTAATGGDTPQFKYATSQGRSCRPGRLESGFCDSPSRSLRRGCPEPVQERRALPRTTTQTFSLPNFTTWWSVRFLAPATWRCERSTNPYGSCRGRRLGDVPGLRNPCPVAAPRLGSPVSRFRACYAGADYTDVDTGGEFPWEVLQLESGRIGASSERDTRVSEASAEFATSIDVATQCCRIFFWTWKWPWCPIRIHKIRARTRTTR